MIRFGFAQSFERSLKGLHQHEKVAIQRQLDSFMLALDVRQIPAGFGLTKYAGDLWEFRTDIALRVLFHWDKSAITFLFVGNHNEVHRFCKYYR